MGFRCAHGSCFGWLYSGVGIVAAIAALAATLFRLYISIHNQLKLASFSGREAKVKQLPLHQSRTQLHALK